MAPVALEPQIRYTPIILAGSHLATVVYLTYTVGLSLYRSHKALGPAQDTRSRTSQRRKLTSAFGSLAALSFVLAVTSGISYLALSYRVWAAARGIENGPLTWNIPYTDDNSIPAPGLYIANWLSQTPIYRDAAEIITEKARRLWWGQQLDLSAMSWSMLLAIEGRRRNVPYLWAYALLAQLVNLSFAQNLFYVAMLLSPSISQLPESRLANLVDRIFPPKPANWVPKPAIFLVLLALDYTAIVAAQATVGTSSFVTAAALSKLLFFAPVMVPSIVPESWGVVWPNPRDSYSSFTTLFRIMSIESVFFHAKATLTGLLYNLPDTYRHRHSIKIPFDTEKRSALDRSTTALERIIGSIHDHPVVLAAGKDVLLSGLGLGLWAAVRAMDVGDMLQSSIPCFPGSVSDERINAEVVKTEQPEEQVSPEPSPEPEPVMHTRSQTLRGKSRVSSISTSNSLDEGTPRRRGRPRKAKSEPALDDKPVFEEDVDFEKHPDSTYRPPPEVEASVIQGDIVPDDDFDWESASLAWGLTALGGLGAGSAAVFGAECISR